MLLWHLHRVSDAWIQGCQYHHKCCFSISIKDFQESVEMLHFVAGGIEHILESFSLSSWQSLPVTELGTGVFFRNLILGVQTIWPEHCSQMSIIRPSVLRMLALKKTLKLVCLPSSKLRVLWRQCW